eukprot:Sspe_Gene.34855::Locus_16925_Transcript_1_1_Confidence_1.000_Length_1352::g.34855::m.34855/K10410/DNALI; dynein light intermediate chain, axonemal
MAAVLGSSWRRVPSRGMASEGQGIDEPPVPPSTLVQYDPPIRVQEAEGKYGNINTIRNQLQQLDDKPMLVGQHEILHMILPPRELEGGWLQYVSSKPATRFDVRDLTNLFEYRLRDSKARETGICPVRSAIYSMCLDELIRQVTVDCPERGLLLLRVRDELRMTTEAYRTLYEASVGFGKKKAIEAEKGKKGMLDKIELLSSTKEGLAKEVKRLEAKLKAMERCCQEQQQADHKKYTEEINFLQQTNKRLKQQEETIKQLQEEEKRKLMSL